jgi:hypothetical protein
VLLPIDTGALGRLVHMKISPAILTLLLLSSRHKLHCVAPLTLYRMSRVLALADLLGGEMCRRSTPAQQEISKYCPLSDPTNDQNQPISPSRKETPCGHSFHGKCVERWLNMKGSCPMCRCRPVIGANSPFS